MSSALTGYNWARRTGRVGLARSIFNRASSDRNRMYGSLASRSRVNARQRNSRAMTVAGRRRNVKSGQGVTNQFDARLIYRKRPMPRYRRRRWRMFANKVKAVSEKDLGSLTIVFNRTNNPNNNTPGNHVMFDFGLYGQQSASFEYNDLKAIADQLNLAVTNSATGLALQKSTKVMFQSAVLDVTIRNASTFNDGTSTRFASEAKMEIDVYEITVRDGDDSDNLYNNLRGLLDNEVADVQRIGNAGTAINRNLRGVTPFDLTYCLSRYGIKIWKKTKYFLSNNDTFTYQMRDPRRRTCTLDSMLSEEGFNKPGWTRCVLVIGKISPGLVVGTTANTYQQVMELGITRKYMLKVENYSEDRNLYVS